MHLLFESKTLFKLKIGIYIRLLNFGTDFALVKSSKHKDKEKHKTGGFSL
jgi:hypothetical protein